HGDPALAEAVREGRRKEAGGFLADGEFADPQDPATFERSKLNWNLLAQTPHSGILAWYYDLLEIRRQNAALNNCRKDLVRTEYDPRARWALIERCDPSGASALLVCNFSESKQAIPIPFCDTEWSLRLWSGGPRYGPSAPEPRRFELVGSSAALYTS